MVMLLVAYFSILPYPVIRCRTYPAVGQMQAPLRERTGVWYGVVYDTHCMLLHMGVSLLNMR